MWLKKIILLLCFQVAFAQSQKATLEDKIYNAVDLFTSNPNANNLQKLEIAEKNFHPKSTTDYLAIIYLYNNKAYYLNQLGQTEKAIKNYEKAWSIFQKNTPKVSLKSYDIIEYCLKPLGNLYTIIGDYDNAENTIKQYFFIANVEKNQAQKYGAILNLSNVYQNTGRLNEAIDLLEKTLQTENLTAIQKGNLYNNLGNNYFLSAKSLYAFNENPFTKGEEAYKKAIALLKSEKNQSETLSNAYRNLAKRYGQTQEFELARTNMDKSRDLFFEVPNKEARKVAQLYYDIALLDFQKGDFALSQINIKAAFSRLLPNYSKSKSILPTKNMLYAETVLLDALDLQAELFLVQNQPKKALESYQLSFHIEELLQSLLIYENSKIVTGIRNRNRTEKCIAIYYSLFQKEKKNSYIEDAFLLSERTKSSVLKQALFNLKNQSQEEKLIVQQLQNWNTTIVKEQQKLDYADIAKINEAIKKQNELMLLLKEKTSTKAKEFKELNISELYVKLEKDKAVMVEYFMGNKTIYIFTLNQNKISLQNVSNEDTAMPKLVQFIDFFVDSKTISSNPKEFNLYANVAYEVLQLPKAKSNKNLIIIPDGILTFLPFEALITKKSTTTNFAKMHYLLNDFRIGYTNSADFYLNSVPFQHEKQSVLGVFPVFENSYLELTFSKKELKNLKANFNGMYLEKEKATFQNFKTNAFNYSILHLSTHASAGDVYEPASIKFYDQEIMYSELYNLKINPDLVVLSACETGIGKLYKAEGAMSVARGFQFAGAQNLLFSLWKVNDYTTSVVMKDFYKSVKKGNSYFDSNHQAKIDFLADSSIPNAKKSPYYWSAFVYYGTLESKESTNYFLYLGLFLIVGIIMVLLFKKHKKANKTNYLDTNI